LDLSRILNSGVYEGQSVNLKPWFDGSLQSTNLNNQPVRLNWLDDGGLDPLYDYLSGSTANVNLRNETNE